MKVEIFIVSCAKHFAWLDYALKSINRFARGFSGVTILIPKGQEMELPDGIKISVNAFMPERFRLGEEWPGKGMLWHMAQIMRADEWCPDADYILHTDSDCIFTEPVFPEDYFVNGKPILYYEKFASITRQYPEVGVWQQVAQDCLPFPVRYETMRRHPAVHHRSVYAKARQEIEAKTKKPVDEYIAGCRNEFPQSFCEFVTLGNVAMEHFRKDYHLIDTFRLEPWPHQKLSQFWSHAPPDQPQSPVYRGKPFTCTPDQLLKLCASAS